MRRRSDQSTTARPAPNRSAGTVSTSAAASRDHGGCVVRQATRSTDRFALSAARRKAALATARLDVSAQTNLRAAGRSNESRVAKKHAQAADVGLHRTWAQHAVLDDCLGWVRCT